MTKAHIQQFMWGYQEHFQFGLKSLAQKVLETLGASFELKAFLVGVLVADDQRASSLQAHQVCVQPEEDTQLVHLFATLRNVVVAKYSGHEMHKMFYSDPETTREMPERIWTVLVREEIETMLHQHDASKGLRSFVGDSVRIGEYRVAPVIQVPEAVFISHPPLQRASMMQYKIAQSLVHAAINAVLDESRRQMQLPNPGRNFNNGSRNADELAILAAGSLLHAPGMLIAKEIPDFDLYRILNEISLMRYERDEGIGRMLLIDGAHAKLRYVFRLEKPVPLRDARWARKILEMATPDTAVIADTRHIHGVGRLDDSYDPKAEEAFWIDFVGHHQWDFRKGEQILMRTRYGIPRLPQEAIEKARFTDNLERQFERCDSETLWSLFNALLSQGRGAMLIIAEDAAKEARRLSGQGTVVRPTLGNADLIASATRIDGTILVDPMGHCHAIGIILDGPANDLCKAARGSRYNSAIRYVGASDCARVAIVLSEDRTIDIHPLLRRRIDRKLVEHQLIALETATIDDFYQPRKFIDENRFYLTPAQCDRANAALERINSLPAPVGAIRWTTNPLTPNPNMNDGYYL